MANTWNKAGTTWGYNSWESDTVTVSLTGISITGSLGTPDAYNVAGWGRNDYGYGSWGVEGIHTTVSLTGLLITGSLGDPASFPNTGWGRGEWGNEPWGDSYNPVINLTGFSITGSLGTLPYAQSEEGWGRDEWGIGNWGENTTTVVLTDSFAITGIQGPAGWGESPWEEQVAWGGDLRFETTQLSIAALTGIEATLSLGTPTISRLDMIFDITGPAAMSAGLGVLNINNGADHSQGVGSLLATMSLGTPTLQVIALPTGFSATMSLGTMVVTEAQLVDLTGIEATGSLGSLTIADMAIGLSGLSITGSVGSLTITDMQVGISGIEMTGAVGSGGVSPLHYKDVDITGYTAYTDIEHSA